MKKNQGWRNDSKRHSDARKYGRASSIPIANFRAKRYLGRWYEQGSTPSWFQSGCKNSVAKYESKGAGKIRVINTCDTKDGKDEAIGTATPTDEPGKLKVGFFPSENPIFESDYEVVHLEGKGGRYKNAIVKSGDYAWILSKDKDMPDRTYNRLKAVARSKGIKTSDIRRTRR